MAKLTTEPYRVFLSTGDSYDANDGPADCPNWRWAFNRRTGVLYQVACPMDLGCNIAETVQRALGQQREREKGTP